MKYSVGKLASIVHVRSTGQFVTHQRARSIFSDFLPSAKFPQVSKLTVRLDLLRVNNEIVDGPVVNSRAQWPQTNARSGQQEMLKTTALVLLNLLQYFRSPSCDPRYK